MTTSATSDFGAGIVVCLAKFSEHLGNEQYKHLMLAEHWLALDLEKRAEWKAKGERRGDVAELVWAGDYVESCVKIWGSIEKSFSHMISIWMNGASDHFYDLDRLRAPKPLIELADLTLEIGHGFMTSDKVWTMKDVEKIFELWQASCLAVDKMLRTEPDWGTW